MPDLIPKERLQPALLDRLTDEQPGKAEESRSRRVISPRELHDLVQRDLAWLLNSANLECTEDLEDYPEVASSVLNFGVPDHSGKTVTDEDLPRIQKYIRRAIVQFEPRIIPRTLEVEVRLEEDEMSHNTMTFFIRGDLWGNPVPTEMYLRTDFDLETGAVSVTDAE